MRKVETGGRDLEAGRKEVGKRIKGALEEIKKMRGKGGERKGRWWDEECSKRKERQGESSEIGEGKEGMRGNTGKTEYRKLCKRKKNEDNERWKKKAMDVKRESEVGDCE